MPATEPVEPELPLWPEPGTEHGGPAAPSPASRAGEGAASPTPPADVPPAVHDRPGPASRPVPGSVREVLQIGLRAGGHGRLAVSDVANSEEEPRHGRGPG
jgi:hypothetical protein